MGRSHELRLPQNPAGESLSYFTDKCSPLSALFKISLRLICRVTLERQQTGSLHFAGAPTV